MSGFAEYDRYDALGLAELVRERQITPGELVEEAIARIEAVNPRINAVVHTMYAGARERVRGELPRGPFTGVPFLLKDLLSGFAGEPLSCGSRAMRGYVPDHDSALVARFKNAGVITVGKTNTPELGLAPVTEPELFGPTRNPWDTRCTPSGSSGGSAAAVAARIVPMAGGGDGGGSIRTPASACGVFGLKPTRGRNPVGPDAGERWQGAAVEHVLTLSVRDSAAMLDATAGPDVGAPYFAPPPARPFLDEVGAPPGRLRIAFTTRSLLGSHVDRECVAGVEATVSLLEDLGHELVEAAPSIDREPLIRAYLTMLCGEVAADIAELGELRGEPIGRDELELATNTLRLMGESVSAGGFTRACRHLQRASRRVQEFFCDHDILLTPTLGQPPFAIGSTQPTRTEAVILSSLRALRVGVGALRAGRVVQRLGLLEKAASKTFEFLAFTPVFNITGQPAASIPLHWSSSGLPIGMHFVARYADEATLFRLAAQLERARPWADRRPAVCAGPAAAIEIE